MTDSDLKKQLKEIPQKPGIYQFSDAENTIIYVGKAKNLKSRVTSYFNGKGHINAKTRALVKNIESINFTIVDSEIDAWLLENNLIKKHQPKYNILLKDDKTFPSICIKNERFPRIFPTRKLIKDGSTYFGPYASYRTMETLLDFIKSIYPLRNCSLNLSPENINAGKFTVCLEYQIGNCKGPCQKFQTEEEYNETIEHIKSLLKGNTNAAISYFKQKMEEAAVALSFETAHIYKEKVELLKNYQSKSTVVNTSISEVDVFSIASDERYAFINYLKVVNGTIIQTQTIELRKKLDESNEDLLSFAITEFRSRYNNQSKEIIIPFKLDIEDENIKFIIPKLGDKKKLLELSEKNVLFFKKSKLEQYEALNPDLKIERILNQLKKDLRLPQLPTHIECFDNSNFQGKNPVSAMVVFKNAKPSKKDYRHFNVKTVEGPNDFATMEEIVYRRYKRVLEENGELPQLIVIDGGKGQLSAALKSLRKLDLSSRVTIIGIAKRLEEIYYPEDSLPLYIDKKSESLRTIQHLRDEAHRFGITFHRKKRDAATLKNELEDIDGIGAATAQKLLTTLKSVKKISTTSLEELETLLDKNKAKKVYEYYKNKEGI